VRRCVPWLVPPGSGSPGGSEMKPTALRALVGGFLVAALLLVGCQLVVSDFSTAAMDGGLDRDQDGAGPDGEDVRPVCVAVEASPDFQRRAGPTTGCGGSLCPPGWASLCVGAEQQISIRQQEGERVRWYDRCVVRSQDQGLAALSCVSAGGAVFHLGNGREAGEVTGEWALYLRAMDTRRASGPAQGCDQSRCDLVDDFPIQLDRRYALLQVVGEVARWFDACELLGSAGTLRCTDALGGTVTLSVAGADRAAPMALSGTWQVYVEPLLESMRASGPTAGCGETPCELWNGLALDAEARYALLKVSDGDAFWFDSCAIDLSEAPGGGLTCVGLDDRWVTIHGAGPEEAGVSSLDGEWSLFRWDVGR
jgi:hypothetical protein